jgi:hypothetical protein
MRIDSSGNVGIGTTSPSNVLHIVSTNATAILQRTTAVGNNSGLSTFDFKNSDSTVSAIANFNKSGSTKSTGADGYEFRFTNHGDGYTSFFNDGSEAMRIDSSGNVGIGTSSPSSQSGDANAFVVGSGSGNQGLTIYSGTTSNGAIRFSDGTSGADTYRGQIDYDHNDNSLKFVTDISERMRIDSSGNVGVRSSKHSSWCYARYETSLLK